MTKKIDCFRSFLRQRHTGAKLKRKYIGIKLEEMHCNTEAESAKKFKSIYFFANYPQILTDK
ncbi:hypothetical protein ATZ36_05715 [Candidatus Endomicrobiellum trichonymphae]|uniref:Uncharacterized protein n=1 Tax=Endomicrobium trichonymphae TaxID=1408204 RepID=A0A1E5II68_ENDTX|nr:hypothetical protein ATZ36_05715 [Candidatus Endomicrobium trichonymphae]